MRIEMSLMALCAVVLVLLSSHSDAITTAVQPSLRTPDSPCPRVLNYVERDPITAKSRWSANIVIRPEQRMQGFILGITLDKPADILGNVIGEVNTTDNTYFEITYKRKLPAGKPFSIRIFVKHRLEVPNIKSIKLNGVQICATGDSSFQVEPRRALARPGDAISLLGQAGVPLRNCHFHLPDNRLIDLSRGRDSSTSERFEYYGRGLASGDCGLKINRVWDEHDGLIKCRVKPADEAAEWMTSATTLRVTSLPEQDLPVFDIVPRRKTLDSGDNITITCNADRPLNLCQFNLPSGRVINMDLGPDSYETPEFRYHGSGLRGGQCGVTLIGVDTRLNGFIVCKVGRWPDGVTGAWEADAMQIRTRVVDARTSEGTQTGRDLGFQPDRVATAKPVSSGRATTVQPTSEYPTRTSQAPASNLTCGQTVVAVPLITNGQGTQRGQWPWHVALYRSAKNGSLLYACGGSLIGARSVVTAAHCVTRQPFDRPVDPATLLVYLGKYHLYQWTDDGLQERQVERVAIHPTYNRTGLKNDLAVLVLKSKVTFTNYVRPVCLWDASRTDLNEVEGREGTVPGWGIDDEGHLTAELMKATMPVVSYTTCLWSHPQHFLQFTRDTTYCAGFKNGTSVCNGDSGGGMVFPFTTSKGKRWFLRGLVSNSVPRNQDAVSMLVCDPQHYVVFTDLAQFLDWLTPFTKL